MCHSVIGRIAAGSVKMPIDYDGALFIQYHVL